MYLHQHGVGRPRHTSAYDGARLRATFYGAFAHEPVWQLGGVRQRRCIISMRTWKVAGAVSLSARSPRIGQGEDNWCRPAALALRPVLGQWMSGSRCCRLRGAVPRTTTWRWPRSPRGSFAEPTWHAQRPAAALRASDRCQIGAARRRSAGRGTGVAPLRHRVCGGVSGP